jgi:hypothetical protein
MHTHSPMVLRESSFTALRPAPIDGKMIDDLVRSFSGDWDESPEYLPDMGEPIARDRQRQNGRELEAYLRRMQHEDLRHTPSGSIRRTSQTMIYRLLETDADDEARELLDTFGDAGDSFTEASRRFDPSLSPDDLYQALRNVWIFNSLQAAAGLHVSCTRSCLAYSLLYPYTDNILDTGSGYSDTKRQFLSMLGARLHGYTSERLADLYPRIDKCIGMIEDEYPREDFAQVYDGILSIHNAQVSSLRLQESANTDLIRRITITKGGTSVLADACLVSGICDMEMVRFSFGFGAALQFVDDLQDSAEDHRNGHRTLFSEPGRPDEIECQTNRLIHILNAFTGNPGWRTRSGRTIGRLFLKGCRRLVLEAMARHSGRYSAAYLRHMEQFSPVTFADLSLLRSRYHMLKKRMPDSPIGKPGINRTIEPGFIGSASSF